MLIECWLGIFCLANILQMITYYKSTLSFYFTFFSMEDTTSPAVTPEVTVIVKDSSGKEL
jgi:hypothetical protein